MNLAGRTGAEFFGTALLLAAVVNSGIMGEKLSGGNIAIAPLANSLATGAMLAALILTFGLLRQVPAGGSHGLHVCPNAWSVAGVAPAHLMFGERFFAAS